MDTKKRSTKTPVLVSSDSEDGDSDVNLLSSTKKNNTSSKSKVTNGPAQKKAKNTAMTKSPVVKTPDSRKTLTQIEDPSSSALINQLIKSNNHHMQQSLEMSNALSQVYEKLIKHHEDSNSKVISIMSSRSTFAESVVIQQMAATKEANDKKFLIEMATVVTNAGEISADKNNFMKNFVS